MYKRIELATRIIPKPDLLIKELRLMVEDPTREQSYVDLEVIIRMLDDATRRVSAAGNINLMYFEAPPIAEAIYLREQLARSLAEGLLKTVDVVSNETLN